MTDDCLGMSGRGSKHEYFDELLFAKFAELDQKVALLREEMDGIALLLERRKRARDSALSGVDQIINDADCLPLWVSLNTHESESHLSNHTGCLRGIAIDRAAEGRLYDADFPSEYAGSCFPSLCNSVNAATRSTFHPYSRPTNNERMTSIRTGRRNALPAFTMPNSDDAFDSPRSLKFLVDFENQRVRSAQPVLLTDPDDSAEDPPSDPDDNVGAAGSL